MRIKSYRASSTNTTNPFGSTFCYGYQDIIFEASVHAPISKCASLAFPGDAKWSHCLGFALPSTRPVCQGGGGPVTPVEGGGEGSCGGGAEGHPLTAEGNFPLRSTCVNGGNLVGSQSDLL